MASRKQVEAERMIYKVERVLTRVEGGDFRPLEGHFRIRKYPPGMEEHTDIYDVTIKGNNRGDYDLWCDCMGFRIQKFPKIQHKHIQLAMHFMELDDVEWALYRIKGRNRIVLVQTSLDVEGIDEDREQ